MHNHSNEMILLNLSAICANPNYSSAKNFQASFYLAFYLFGLIAHILVMPATAKLAKKWTAFSILLNINIMHLLMIVWSMELYVGYFVGHRILVPFDLDAFLYQFCVMAVALAYNLLAVNRIIAIMAPFLYNYIFTKRFTRICLIFCWLFGLAYSLMLHFKPYLRIFSCISFLTTPFPAIFIEEHNLYFDIFKIVCWVNLITTSYTPTLLYVICLIWMVSKRVWKVNAHAAGHGHHHQHYQAKDFEQHHQQVSPPLTTSPLLDNYSRERMRLYGICILGTMPPFLFRVFLVLYLRNWTESHFHSLYNNIYKILSAIFHIEQPMVMLLLSSELRAEMCRVFDKILKKIRPVTISSRGCLTKQKNAIIRVKAAKIAWALRSTVPQKEQQQQHYQEKLPAIHKF